MPGRPAAGRGYTWWRSTTAPCRARRTWSRISCPTSPGWRRSPTLVNAWGIALNPAGPFWISSQGQDLSEVYVGDVNGSPISTAFTVSIPGGEPTGQVFNGSNDFRVTSGPARFIFASETGAITGWNPGVPPTKP